VENLGGLGPKLRRPVQGEKRPTVSKRPVAVHGKERSDGGGEEASTGRLWPKRSDMGLQKQCQNKEVPTEGELVNHPRQGRKGKGDWKKGDLIVRPNASHLGEPGDGVHRYQAGKSTRGQVGDEGEAFKRT